MSTETQRFSWRRNSGESNHSVLCRVPAPPRRALPLPNYLPHGKSLFSSQSSHPGGVKCPGKCASKGLLPPLISLRPPRSGSPRRATEVHHNILQSIKLKGSLHDHHTKTSHKPQGSTLELEACAPILLFAVASDLIVQFDRFVLLPCSGVLVCS